MPRTVSRGWLHDRARRRPCGRRPVSGRTSTPRSGAWRAELDRLGLGLPEEHGGTGQGLVELALVAEEIGRATARGPFLATALVGRGRGTPAAGDRSTRGLPRLVPRRPRRPRRHHTAPAGPRSDRHLLRSPPRRRPGASTAAPPKCSVRRGPRLSPRDRHPAHRVTMGAGRHAHHPLGPGRRHAHRTAAAGPEGGAVTVLGQSPVPDQHGLRPHGAVRSLEDLLSTSRHDCGRRRPGPGRSSGSAPGGPGGGAEPHGALVDVVTSLRAGDLVRADVASPHKITRQAPAPRAPRPLLRHRPSKGTTPPSPPRPHCPWAHARNASSCMTSGIMTMLEVSSVSLEPSPEVNSLMRASSAEPSTS